MSIQIFILGKLMEKNSYPYLFKKTAIRTNTF